MPVPAVQLGPVQSVCEALVPHHGAKTDESVQSPQVAPKSASVPSVPVSVQTIGFVQPATVDVGAAVPSSVMLMAWRSEPDVRPVQLSATMPPVTS